MANRGTGAVGPRLEPASPHLLFIADDTGLGRTIEAGLIARELLLRRKVRSIVTAAPPSVPEQWKGELENRFGLVFEVLRGCVSRMRREHGFGVNPWRTHSRFLVSHNLLIDPAYTDPLREWLGPIWESCATTAGVPRRRTTGKPRAGTARPPSRESRLARFNLGLMYAKGEGVQKKDDVEAYV